MAVPARGGKGDANSPSDPLRTTPSPARARVAGSTVLHGPDKPGARTRAAAHAVPLPLVAIIAGGLYVAGQLR